MQQLELDLFPTERPSMYCEHELQTVAMNDNGGNVKSLCDLTCASAGHPTWTNCREWGSCTMADDAL